MKLDQQRVLAGSLNLLTPNDKTPENDAIALQNFRVDQAGVLRAADTFSVLADIGVPVHTVYRLDDFATTQAYVAGIENISFGPNGAYLFGAGGSLFFSWPDAGGELLNIAGGFSGQPLSIVPWNGFIWVLDSARQVKINPAFLSGLTGGALYSVTSWLPAVPASPVGVAANTTGDGQLNGAYVYYCTYVKPQFVSGVYTRLESGPSPGFGVTAAGGVVSITGIPFPPFASSATPDTFDQVRIYRRLASGATAQFVTQFGAGLDPNGNTSYRWLTSDYPSIDDPFVDDISDAAIASSAAMPASGAAGAPAAPTLAIAAVGGFAVAPSAALVGTYRYYETYVNSAGLETNPGAVSPYVTPTNGKVDLTLTVSPDSDVVRRRLYRDGGTLGQAYQVTEITDNTTTAYTDSAPDVAITLNGVAMPTTNDPPPTGGTYAGVTPPYFNRMLAWKDGVLFWSQDGTPLFPDSQQSDPTGNWVNVGVPDDKIQMISLHTQTAAIYKQRSVWRLAGDVVNGTLTGTDATCGAYCKSAVANAGAVDYVGNRDGVYLCDIDQMHSQSDKLMPVFLGQPWANFGLTDVAQPAWLAGSNFRPMLAFLNGTLLVSNCSGLSFLYHAGTQRWAQFNSNLGYPITAAVSFGSAYQWFAGDSAGNLLAANQVGAVGQTCVWQTRFLDQGLGDTPKHYQEVVVDAELNGWTMTVYVLQNGALPGVARAAVASPYKASFVGTTRAKYYLPLNPDMGEAGQPNISVRVELTAPNGYTVSPAIHGLYIYYAVEERDASVRGTQVLDFRSERMQIARRLEVDATGNLALTISTDEPGGMAQRYAIALSFPSRGLVEFNLPPNVRGRLWRVDVTPETGSANSPTGTVRLYSARGWMMPMNEPNAQWAWKDFLRGAESDLPDVE